MLNIGKLAPGAGEYYVGEVASSAEDYYTGRGEAQGRWVGSLRPVLGLDGEVDPEHFRRILLGLHPWTGESLVSAQGSAGRAQSRSSAPTGGALSDIVDSARAAAFLGVSHQHVRRLLKAGSEYQQALLAADHEDVVTEASSYLLGERVSVGEREQWQIPRSEVERFAADRPARKFRPGYDVTLRPPKSVSVLWALSKPEVGAEIRQAHTEAVDEVVRYLEDRAIRGRMSVDRRQVEVETDGVIAAAFDHRTSRAGDPLLHTHVVVANMTRLDGEDGPAWRAIAAHGLFEHAKAAGHLYQAHLRHLLTARLGLGWSPVHNGYADVDGVPEQVIELFSKRRSEIAEVLAESGNTSARAAQVATLQTRKPKGYQVDADTLYELWRVEATAAGFGPAQAASCLQRATIAQVDEQRVARIFAEVAGPAGLTERASVFRRSDVIEALANRCAADCPAQRIEALADRLLSSVVCSVVDDAPPSRRDDSMSSLEGSRRRGSTQTKYTTVELAALEVELLSWATDSTTSRRPLPEAVVQAVVQLRPELSAEQAQMVQRITEAGTGVEPVAGRPGAGKTYATEAVVAAHVAAGVPILGCAVSATAAAELESAAGFTRSVMPATTVAKLLMDLDRWGGLAAGAMVVVDEASMISTRELHRLVGHARRAGGSVVLIGDPDQHGPVEVGGVFQRLCRDRGESLVELVENNRQRDHVDRLAIAEYRDGHIDEALARLDNAGRVVRSATAGESFDAMVADWYADRLAGRADPMIAGPNSTRRALNDRARSLLKEHGDLAGAPVIVAGREFMVGDTVVARRNDRRLRAGPEGDFVKNGSAGNVVEVHPEDREVTVDFETEGRIRVPNAYLAAGRLEHGYARTTYGVQGATHATARYHPTDLSGFEEGYVAITRGRDANRLYIVDGTIGTADDEAHHRPDTEHFDLDHLGDALTRRRSTTMAADAADDLPSVHTLATHHTLAELARRRRGLEAALAEAPADASRAIEQAEATLDTLRARRALAALDRDGTPSRMRQLDRAITRADGRRGAALERQTVRTRWLDDHADLVDEYQVVVRAERHRRTRIADNPAAYLPAADRSARPAVSQIDRRRERAAMIEQALAADLGNGQAVPESDSVSPEVG
ncbi:MAG: MobF family relaxase [Acidimicrobiia bacterium]